MTLKVIRTSLDWFQCSFVGDLDSEAEELLPKLKSMAQVHNAPEPYMLGLNESFVLDKGRGFFPYVLKHPEFEICLAPNAAKGFPSASVRLSAFGLSNTEPGALWDSAVESLTHLGQFTPLTLTRVDVAVDFQGWEPTSLDMRGIVCDASYRATHGTEKEVQRPRAGAWCMKLPAPSFSSIAFSRP